MLTITGEAYAEPFFFFLQVNYLLHYRKIPVITQDRYFFYLIKSRINKGFSNSYYI